MDVNGTEADRARADRPNHSNIIRPLTLNNFYSYYMPINGCISYYAFSLHCSLPGGLIRVLPPIGLRFVNCLLFNSHIGIGFHLYMSRHMRAMPVYNRIMFSAFGSVMFNFSSILFSATTKALLPDKTWLRILFSIFTSFSFITIANEYIKTINNLI